MSKESLIGIATGAGAGLISIRMIEGDMVFWVGILAIYLALAAAMFKAAFLRGDVKVYSHFSPWGQSYRVEINDDVYTQSADGLGWFKNHDPGVPLGMKGQLASEIRWVERDGAVIREEDWTFESIIPDGPGRREAVAEWETKMIGYHRGKP